jgi:hypothetical protein
MSGCQLMRSIRLRCLDENVIWHQELNKRGIQTQYNTIENSTLLPIGTRTTLETSTITNLSGNYVLQRDQTTTTNKKLVEVFFYKGEVWNWKSKGLLARNQGNVSECGDMSIPGLLFQWASTIKTQLRGVLIC